MGGKRLVLPLVGLYCCVFGLFFVGALTNTPYTYVGDNAWYASELICGTTSASPHCSDTPSNEIPLFRGNVQEDTTQLFKGAEYPSSLFASFVRLFVDSRDSYREAILKIFAIKSLLIAAALATVAMLVISYPYLRRTVVRLIAVMFSVPFILETGAGFYPGGFAAIGLLPCLLVLVVMQRESSLSTRAKVTLPTVFCLCAALVVSNRFDTAVFLVLACFLFGFRSLTASHNSRRSRWGMIMPFTAGVFITGAALFLNGAWSRLFHKALNRGIAVVPPNTPSRSVDVVEKVGLPGDLAYMLMAPVTMIDNSTRFFLNRTYVGLFGDTAGRSIEPILFFIYFVITSIAWFPMFAVVGGGILRLVREIGSSLHGRKQPSITDVLPVLLIILYFVIPVYARLVWSWWYLVPLLMLFVALAKDTPIGGVERFALPVAVSNSVLSLIVVNWRLGDLYLAGTVFAKEFVTGFLILCSCGVFLALRVSARKVVGSAGPVYSS